jgi:hypothetical protein
MGMGSLEIKKKLTASEFIEHFPQIARIMDKAKMRELEKKRQRG